MAGLRRAKTKAEPLGRFGPVIASESFWPPGHSGPRPVLAFVLETLAGRDPGMIEFHLNCTHAWAFHDGRQFAFIRANRHLLNLAEKSMVEWMRHLADLWIDSGKSGLGLSVDNPSRRNVEYEPEFGMAPIYRIFYARLGNVPQYPTMFGDGSQGVQETFFGFDEERLSNCSYEEAVKEFGEKVATYWFARFLRSGFSRHLSRCDECKAYFAYERAPKTDIKTGVFCPNCKGRGAARRVKSARDSLKDDMVKAAATLWDRFQKSRSNPDKHVWVAQQLNRQFVKRLKEPKTRKWVSQNLERIEAEIKRRNDAKG